MPRGADISRVAPAVLLIALSGCDAAPARRAPAGPAAVMPSGRRYALEIVATPEVRAQGLMFRESLESGRGMVFLFPKPSVESFWMKNCNFPIDIVWLDEQRRVIFVSEKVPPCREDPCPTYGPGLPSLYVLEIPAGAAAREGVRTGSRIAFEALPPPPAI
jgi:uncharacterized protein